METKKTNLLDFVKSILEFMEENSSRFNDEKLDIMCSMPDYINNNISDEESIVIYNQIQSIENTMNLETSKNDYGDIFNKNFIRRDMMSLGTMYLMAVSIDKKIYRVDDSLIYYVINSLRGEEYEHYSILLKGLLYEELLDGVKSMQENEPSNTDRIRSAFSSLVDNKILDDIMNEKELDNIMKGYLETREISIGEGKIIAEYK